MRPVEEAREVTGMERGRGRCRSRPRDLQRYIDAATSRHRIDAAGNFDAKPISR